MSETVTQQLSNALANSAQGYAGEALQGQATSGYMQCYPNQWYYYTPTTYCTTEHVYSEDEKLLLNAIRRDEKLKDKTLKFVLAELLKSLEK